MASRPSIATLPTLPSPPSASLRVAVVGAGAAGLVAVRELLKAGHQPVAFEQASTIGGVWLYTDHTELDDPLGVRPDAGRRVHSSLYANLRVNLPREIMGYLDLPFLPKAMRGRSVDARRYCGHQEVQAYLEAYAEQYDLLRHIRFNTRVNTLTRVVDQPGAKEQPGAEERHAPGPQWRVVHTTTAIDKGDNKGNKGSKGNTGSNTAQSNRHDGVQSNRHDDGVDLKSYSNGMQHDDDPECDSMHITSTAPQSSPQQHQEQHQEQNQEQHQELFDAVMVCHGHYATPRNPDVPHEGYQGLVMHAHNYRTPDMFVGKRVMVVGAANSGTDLAFEIGGVASELLWSALHWKGQDTILYHTPLPNTTITPVPMLTRLQAPHTAILSDGTRVDNVHAVVYCTGYQYTLPFLHDPDVVQTDGTRIFPLYRHILPPEAPSLAFLGLPWEVAPMPLMQLQAAWVSRAWAGMVPLPSTTDMVASVQEEEAERRARGVKDRHVHRLGDAQWGYLEYLSDAAGVEGLPAWRKEYYMENRQLRIADKVHYRDAPFLQHNPALVEAVEVQAMDFIMQHSNDVAHTTQAAA